MNPGVYYFKIMQFESIWLVGTPEIVPFGVHYSNNEPGVYYLKIMQLEAIWMVQVPKIVD